jgi:hypothetical protein
MLMDLGLVDEAMRVNPQLNEYDEAIGRGDMDLGLSLARAEVEEDPVRLRTQFRMMYMLVYATTSPEDAMPLAESIWQEFADSPIAIGGFLLDMALFARMAEFPTEAQRFRDAAAESLQRRLEVGEAGGDIAYASARLALLDGRKADALQALGRSIDLGRREPRMTSNLFFEDLKDDPQFQALVGRMRDTIERERAEVVAMLCGPDKIVSIYEPAPETCALYPIQ